MARQKIEDVEGIGPIIGGKLCDCGIETKTPKQRKALAERAGLSETRVLKFAELLEASGVDTVPELARHAPTEAGVTKRVAQVKELLRVLSY